MAAMPIIQREVFFRWNPDTKRYDIRDEQEMTYHQPDQKIRRKR